MKIKEIEFGVTANLGNYEASKLSMRVELEDWENPEQTLAQLKEKVVELVGGDTQLMRRVAAENDRRKSAQKAELDGLISQITQINSKIEDASKLVGKLEGLKRKETTLLGLYEIVTAWKCLTEPLGNSDPDNLDNEF